MFRKCKEAGEKQVQVYRVPDLRFYEVGEALPATAKEADPLAKADDTSTLQGPRGTR